MVEFYNDNYELSVTEKSTKDDSEIRFCQNHLYVKSDWGPNNVMSLKF